MHIKDNRTIQQTLPYRGNIQFRCRTFLTVREAAFLLQRSEAVVRRMLGAGELRCFGEWETADGRQRRRLSPESVREHFPIDRSGELQRLAMGAILAGRLRVPAPAERWGAPAPLGGVVNPLAAHAFQSAINPYSQQLIEHSNR